MFVPPICQGRIIWINVPGKGGKAKRRPVVITTSDAEITAETELAGIVCSHTSANVEPRPADYVEIPHHPAGRCRTKLRKPTVAVCRWPVKLKKEEIAGLAADDFGGVVNPNLLEKVIKTTAALQGPAK